MENFRNGERWPDRQENDELFEFTLSVHRLAEVAAEWRVEVYEGSGFRAATEAGDLDTALRMAVPYLASSCEPDPLAALARDAVHPALRPVPPELT